MSVAPPDHVIPAGNILGEGIQWHDGRLWWTDIHGRCLHRHDWASGATQVMAMPERVGSFALTGVDDRLLCAFETGFAHLDLGEGTLAWRARPEQPGSGVRFNDGRVDRRGAFWAGTMVEDAARAAGRRGTLYRFDGDGAVTAAVDDIGIANGLAWSPDGRWMYFADSPRRVIWRFAVDPDTGLPHDRTEFAETPDGAFPDGACVDADGGYWSAQWGASRVVRYTPAGAVDRVITVPVSQPSCVALGGDDLKTLCVTTARDGLDAAALAGEPLAGDVLLYRVDVAGLPEMRVSSNSSRS